MRPAGLWTCFVLAGGLSLSFGSTEPGPLFLTPLIKDGKIGEARNLSKVGFFKQLGIDASAYSGYISVGDDESNNLFFLFIEAENNPSEAPLTLWTPGGPGLSAIFSLFLQNGPVKFDARYNGSTIQPIFSRREFTIQKHTSVIYLDAPVGAGFSFTNNSNYPTQLDDVTQNITEFLKQFLKLFTEYKGRDFYAAGDSYAARYSVALADYMLRCPSDDLNLKFEGVIGGVGFLAPIFDLADSSDFLYQASMLDKKGYGEFKARFQLMKQFMQTGNYTLALGLLFSTIFTSEPKTLFQNLTLYNSHATPLYTERPLPMIACVGFVNSTAFKIAIHAGQNASVQYANPLLLQIFAGDWLVDITEKVEYVLNNTRVLLYTGQMDALFPSANHQAYLENIFWKHKEQYLSASRSLWQPYAGYYGGGAYTKSAKNFTLATVLGMGHYAGFDKPLETYYLMREFINRTISFSSQLM